MPWNKSGLSTEARVELVKGLLARSEPARALCLRYGVSRQTGFKLLRRFLVFGLAGLGDRRRGRRLKHPVLWAGYRRELLRLRRHRPRWGAAKLRWALRQERAKKGQAAEIDPRLPWCLTVANRRDINIRGLTLCSVP